MWILLVAWWAAVGACGKTVKQICPLSEQATASGAVACLLIVGLQVEAVASMGLASIYVVDKDANIPIPPTLVAAAPLIPSRESPARDRQQA